MRVVPQLRSDEEFFPRDLGLADGLANRGLRAIDASRVDMSISCLQWTRKGTRQQEFTANVI